MIIINGRKMSSEIFKGIRKEIAETGIRPGLAAILVGNNSASETYVRIKEKACADTGIYFEKYGLPETASENRMLELIAHLNKKGNIHGILIQLPLPRHLDTDRIIAAIDPAKDVDGFHPENAEAIKKGYKPNFIPPLLAGILDMIKSTGTELPGKKALVAANSEIFLDTAEKIMEMEGIETGTHMAEQKGLEKKSLGADILIIAVGRPRFVKADMVKENSLVIDAGYNMVDGKPVGDVDFESVSKKAAFIAPVPGGAGPMTVAMLLKNVLLAAKTAS